MSEKEQLDIFRSQIKDLTLQIFRLLGKRIELAKNVGVIKASIGLPLIDSDIEEGLRGYVEKECLKMGLEPRIGHEFLTEIFSQTVQIEKLSMNSDEKNQVVTVSEMMKMSDEAEMRGRRIIRLEVGEPDLPVPEKVIGRTSEALREGHTRYTSHLGKSDLRIAIAEHLNQKYALDLKQNNVIVSSGARFGIFVAMMSSLSRGDEIIVITPSWSAYKEMAELQGVRVRTIRTEYEKNWIPELDVLEKNISRTTKMLVLNYPNNPTGKILDESILRSIVDIAKSNDVILLSDEVYSDYAFTPYKSLLHFPECSTIMASSFSKSHSMTGFRIGYVVADKNIIERMAAFQRVSMMSLPDFVQEGAISALGAPEVDDNVRVMRERMEKSCAMMKSLPLRFHRPDGAMYIFVGRTDDGQFDSSRFAIDLLSKKEVAISPGSAFGDHNDFFRISLCQPQEVINEGIRRIGEAIS